MKLEIDIAEGMDWGGITVNITDTHGMTQQILNISTQDKSHFIDIGLVSAAINYSKRKFLENLKEAHEKAKEQGL